MADGQVLQVAAIAPPRALPTIEDLRAWDWRDELRRQERGMTWLARKTDRSVSAVYRYSDGTLTPPDEWLRSVARLLGIEAAAA